MNVFARLWTALNSELNSTLGQFGFQYLQNCVKDRSWDMDKCLFYLSRIQLIQFAKTVCTFYINTTREPRFCHDNIYFHLNHLHYIFIIKYNALALKNNTIIQFKRSQVKSSHALEWYINWRCIFSRCWSLRRVWCRCNHRKTSRVFLWAPLPCGHFATRRYF